MTTATATAAPTTFAELWEELKTGALNLVQSVKNEAVALEASIVPVAEQDIVLVLSQLKSVATNTVLTLAGNLYGNLTGTQKNAITVNTIVQAAAAAGKSVALQDAQMLAQQAYYGIATALAPAASK